MYSNRSHWEYWDGVTEEFYPEILEAKTYNPVSLQANRLWVSELQGEAKSALFTHGDGNKYSLQQWF